MPTIKIQTELLCSTFTGIKQPFITVTDSMGQEFGWDTAKMACLCSRASQALDERLEARDWIQLKAHSLTCLAVDDSTQLGAWLLSTWPLHVVSLCGGFRLSHRKVAGFQSWTSCERKPGVNCIACCNLASTCRFQFVGTSQACPDSRDWERDSTPWWGVAKFWKRMWDLNYCCRQFLKLQTATHFSLWILSVISSLNYYKLYEMFIFVFLCTVLSKTLHTIGLQNMFVG